MNKVKLLFIALLLFKTLLFFIRLLFWFSVYKILCKNYKIICLEKIQAFKFICVVQSLSNICIIAGWEPYRTTIMKLSF